MKSISGVLRRIDGRGYKAYRDLLGAREGMDGYSVEVVRVQGDPFAPPSVVRVRTRVRLPPIASKAPVAVEDLLARRLHDALARRSMRGVGEGGSGLLASPRLSPVMVRRSVASVRHSGDGLFDVSVTVWVGLPSRGRRVMAGVARELLLSRLPKALEEALRNLHEGLGGHVNAWVEQEYIRSRLRDMGLVSFIGNGSILPRRCGGCWEPLEDAVPFESPKSLEVEIELPTGRVVRGMGVRRGLTVVTGPAFHGKTTLAEAIMAGVWNHIPGDGRELVVTIKEAVGVESENGRWVSCVDLSPWIKGLPGGRGVRCFTTADASGATSVAASIQEAVEAGARLLVIDEDYTATNIIHRDYWVEEVTGKKTLVTIPELASGLKELGVSIVMVASGSPPLLAMADQIIVMDEYKPLDATWYRGKAREALEALRYKEEAYTKPPKRRITKSISLFKPKLRGRILEARGLKDRVDLSVLRQLEEEGQLKTAVRLALRVASTNGAYIIDESRRVVKETLKELHNHPAPDAAEVRPIDVVMIVNRIPGLEVRV